MGNTGNMGKIGLWKTSKGFVSHAKGLTAEQVQYLHNLKEGDRLAVFANDVREGEKGPDITLVRSTLPSGELTPTTAV